MSEIFILEFISVSEVTSEVENLM